MTNTEQATTAHAYEITHSKIVNGKTITTPVGALATTRRDAEAAAVKLNRKAVDGSLYQVRLVDLGTYFN